MKLKTLVISAICAGSLVGCATIFTGTTQPVQIKTMNAESNEPFMDANCRLEDEKGHVYSVFSPNSITLPKSGGTLTISCKKPGYQSTQKVVNNSFQPVTILDLFFWPTAIVDLSTGAYMKYPTDITVSMQPTGKRARS